MAGAISGSTIASLVAMMASAAIQYKNNQDAAERATRETQRALARQAELQRQAEGAAMEQAKQFNTDDRAEKQQEVTAQLEEDFAQPAEAAQTINQQAATTQGDVSKDYVMAKAASDANQMRMARNLAALLAKTTGANRLRQNEAIDMANTTANIGRLQDFSMGNYDVDKRAIKNAAVPSGGMDLVGTILQGVGSVSMAKNGTGSDGAGGLGLGKSSSLEEMRGGTGINPWAKSPKAFAAPIG